MVAPNRRSRTLLLFAVANIIGHCFASLSVPHSKPLTCEGKFKDVEKLTLNETSLHVDISKLMDSYSTDWSKHLDAAPLAINVLGKLAIMSYKKMDIHKNKSKKDKLSRRNIFGTYNYPTSIRNSLLQITGQGNSAFHKAHTNMKKIRMYNSNISSHFKDVTRCLMSRNHTYIIEFLPTSLQKIQEVADKSQELSTEVVKEFKIVVESTEEIIVTIKQMELKRRNTQPIVERNKSSLHFTKMYYRETIKALKTASNELSKLKTALTQLIEFYSKMSTFITEATKESLALIDIVKVITKYVNRVELDDKEILANFTESVQKATEASFLVHGVSDMCVDVSEMYIVDQIGNLEYVMKNLQALLAHVANKNEYETLLQWNIKSGSEGIRYYVEADETLLRNNLVERHNEIVNEYRWMQDCDSNEDRQFV